MEHALLNDLVEFLLNVTHQSGIGEDVHETIAEPEIQIEDIKHSFQVNEVENRFWDRKRPVDLSAKPAECDGVVSAVLSSILENEEKLVSLKIEDLR